MATLRLHLLLGTALIAAAGCAQQPVRADHTSPPAMSLAAPATAAATAASIQAMKGAVSPNLLLFAHDQGYRQVVIKGDDYYFCKTEDPMDSIIPVRQCLDRVQLESLRVRVEQQQQQLSRRAAETTTIH
ncbi:MAG: hypothetical protein ACREVO_07840 [Steroidobacteraceae bacterium]